ncbi:5-formyltetrahydrofolate cyclo-ligase [Nitratifractor sp.]
MAGKQAFREWALKRLRCKRRSESYVRDKRIQIRLRKLLEQRNPRTVMLYLPLKMEADVRPLIRWLRRRGAAVYVPFMEGESFRLVKYRLPLRKKRFGIYEPNNSKQYRKKKIDLAIVPIVGVDAGGRRIGFGKGMYDRFFAREAGNITETIFIQRDLCWSPEIITDSYDIRGDMIVTAEGVYRIERGRRAEVHSF